MNQWKILIAEPESFSPKALALLGEVGSVECKILKQHEVRKALEEYDVVWVRLHLKVKEEDIPPTSCCKYIVSATTGTDHLDVDKLNQAGIKVLCLREERDFLETIGVTAELTLGLILALVRSIPAAHDAVVRLGRWDRNSYRGFELFGKTAGVVGLGRLGKKMARYLSALGMNIVGWDPYAPNVDGVKSATNLDSLLLESHVVTLHIPLNDETRGMFDNVKFAVMRKGSFFINTSRGALVDEDALLDVLHSGHLAGAALDVLRGEPGIDLDHPLVRYAGNHSNLLITPHIGGAVEGVMGRCEEYMAEILYSKLSNYYLL